MMDTRKRRKDSSLNRTLPHDLLHRLPKRPRVQAQRKFAQGSQPPPPLVNKDVEAEEFSTTGGTGTIVRERSTSLDGRPGLVSRSSNTASYGRSSVDGSSGAFDPYARGVLGNGRPQFGVPLRGQYDFFSRGHGSADVDAGGGNGLDSSDDVLLPVRPKTEDFLTFLCFRGTPLLPSAFDHFNTPQIGLLKEGGASRTARPGSDKPEAEHSNSLKGSKSSKTSIDGDTPASGNGVLLKENAKTKTSEEGVSVSANIQRVTRSAQVPVNKSAASRRGALSALHRKHVTRSRLLNSKKQLIIKKALELKSKCIHGRQSRLSARTGVSRNLSANGTEKRVTRSTEYTPETDDGAQTDVKKRCLERREKLRRRSCDGVSETLAQKDGSPARRPYRNAEVRSKSIDQHEPERNTEAPESRPPSGSHTLEDVQTASERSFRSSLRRPSASKSDETFKNVRLEMSKVGSPARSAVATAALKKSRLAKMTVTRPKPKISRLLLRLGGAAASTGAASEGNSTTESPPDTPVRHTRRHTDPRPPPPAPSPQPGKVLPIPDKASYLISRLRKERRRSDSVKVEVKEEVRDESEEEDVRRAATKALRMVRKEPRSLDPCSLEDVKPDVSTIDISPTKAARSSTAASPQLVTSTLQEPQSSLASTSITSTPSLWSSSVSSVPCTPTSADNSPASDAATVAKSSLEQRASRVKRSRNGSVCNSPPGSPGSASKLPCSNTNLKTQFSASNHAFNCNALVSRLENTCKNEPGTKSSNSSAIEKPVVRSKMNRGCAVAETPNGASPAMISPKSETIQEMRRLRCSLREDRRESSLSLDVRETRRRASEGSAHSSQERPVRSLAKHSSPPARPLDNSRDGRHKSNPAPHDSDCKNVRLKSRNKRNSRVSGRTVISDSTTTTTSDTSSDENSRSAESTVRKSQRISRTKETAAKKQSDLKKCTRSWSSESNRDARSRSLSRESSASGSVTRSGTLNRDMTGTISRNSRRIEAENARKKRRSLRGASNISKNLTQSESDERETDGPCTSEDEAANDGDDEDRVSISHNVRSRRSGRSSIELTSSKREENLASKRRTRSVDSSQDMNAIAVAVRTRSSDRTKRHEKSSETSGNSSNASQTIPYDLPVKKECVSEDEVDMQQGDTSEHGDAVSIKLEKSDVNKLQDQLASTSLEEVESSSQVLIPSSLEKGVSSSALEDVNSSALRPTSIGVLKKRASVPRRKANNPKEKRLDDVLGSVAKDFGDNIDEGHYSKMERDLALGNKSPEKQNKNLILKKCINIPSFTSRMETEFVESVSKSTSSSEANKSNVANGLDSVMFYASNSNLNCNSPNQSSSGTLKPAPSLPKTPRRGPFNAKKLSDVVRSLAEKKHAESPLSCVADDKPDFLKDLKKKSLDDDKQRQVREVCLATALDACVFSSATTTTTTTLSSCSAAPLTIPHVSAIITSTSNVSASVVSTTVTITTTKSGNDQPFMSTSITATQLPCITTAAVLPIKTGQPQAFSPQTAPVEKSSHITSVAYTQSLPSSVSVPAVSAASHITVPSGLTGSNVTDSSSVNSNENSSCVVENLAIVAVSEASTDESVESHVKGACQVSKNKVGSNKNTQRLAERKLPYASLVTAQNECVPKKSKISPPVFIPSSFTKSSSDLKTCVSANSKNTFSSKNHGIVSDKGKVVSSASASNIAVRAETGNHGEPNSALPKVSQKSPVIYHDSNESSVKDACKISSVNNAEPSSHRNSSQSQKSSSTVASSASTDVPVSTTLPSRMFYGSGACRSSTAERLALSRHLIVPSISATSPALTASPKSGKTGVKHVLVGKGAKSSARGSNSRDASSKVNSRHLHNVTTSLSKDTLKKTTHISSSGVHTTSISITPKVKNTDKLDTHASVNITTLNIPKVIPGQRNLSSIRAKNIVNSVKDYENDCVDGIPSITINCDNSEIVSLTSSVTATYFTSRPIDIKSTEITSVTCNASNESKILPSNFLSDEGKDSSLKIPTVSIALASSSSCDTRNFPSHKDSVTVDVQNLVPSTPVESQVLESDSSVNDNLQDLQQAESSITMNVTMPPTPSATPVPQPFNSTGIISSQTNIPLYVTSQTGSSSLPTPMFTSLALSNSHIGAQNLHIPHLPVDVQSQMVSSLTTSGNVIIPAGGPPLTQTDVNATQLPTIMTPLPSSVAQVPIDASGLPPNALANLQVSNLPPGIVSNIPGGPSGLVNTVPTPSCVLPNLPQGSMVPNIPSANLNAGRLPTIQSPNIPPGALSSIQVPGLSGNAMPNLPNTLPALHGGIAQFPNVTQLPNNLLPLSSTIAPLTSNIGNQVSLASTTTTLNTIASLPSVFPLTGPVAYNTVAPYNAGVTSYVTSAPQLAYFDTSTMTYVTPAILPSLATPQGIITASSVSSFVQPGGALPPSYTIMSIPSHSISQSPASVGSESSANGAQALNTSGHSLARDSPVMMNTPILTSSQSAYVSNNTDVCSLFPIAAGTLNSGSAIGLATPQFQSHVLTAGSPAPNLNNGTRPVLFPTSGAMVAAGSNQMSASSSPVKLPKQIHIAPKPNRMSAPSGSTAATSSGAFKPSSKPVQIAPKLVSQPLTVPSAVSKLHSSPQILTTPQGSHLLHTIPQLQHLQALPQGLQAFSSTLQGVQALPSHMPSIAGVQGISVTQALSLSAATQLVTPPVGKILSQQLIVTTMANVESSQAAFCSSTASQYSLVPQQFVSTQDSGTGVSLNASVSNTLSDATSAVAPSYIGSISSSATVSSTLSMPCESQNAEFQRTSADVQTVSESNVADAAVTTVGLNQLPLTSSSSALAEENHAQKYGGTYVDNIPLSRPCVTRTTCANFQTNVGTVDTAPIPLALAKNIGPVALSSVALNIPINYSVGQSLRIPSALPSSAKGPDYIPLRSENEPSSESEESKFSVADHSSELRICITPDEVPCSPCSDSLIEVTDNCTDGVDEIRDKATESEQSTLPESVKHQKDSNATGCAPGKISDEFPPNKDNAIINSVSPLCIPTPTSSTNTEDEAFSRNKSSVGSSFIKPVNCELSTSNQVPNDESQSSSLGSVCHASDFYDKSEFNTEVSQASISKSDSSVIETSNSVVSPMCSEHISVSPLQQVFEKASSVSSCIVPVSSVQSSLPVLTAASVAYTSNSNVPTSTLPGRISLTHIHAPNSLHNVSNSNVAVSTSLFSTTTTTSSACTEASTVCSSAAPVISSVAPVVTSGLSVSASASPVSASTPPVCSTPPACTTSSVCSISPSSTSVSPTSTSASPGCTSMHHDSTSTFSGSISTTACTSTVCASASSVCISTSVLTSTSSVPISKAFSTSGPPVCNSTSPISSLTSPVISVSALSSLNSARSFKASGPKHLPVLPAPTPRITRGALPLAPNVSGGSFASSVALVPSKLLSPVSIPSVAAKPLIERLNTVKLLKEPPQATSVLKHLSSPKENSEVVENKIISVPVRSEKSILANSIKLQQRSPRSASTALPSNSSATLLKAHSDSKSQHTDGTEKLPNNQPNESDHVSKIFSKIPPFASSSVTITSVPTTRGSDSCKTNLGAPEKAIVDKKKDSVLKRPLFRTKSQENVSKSSFAFSVVNESSVYAFEPDVDLQLEETSAFSKRIKKKASVSVTCLKSTSDSNKNSDCKSSCSKSVPCKNLKSPEKLKGKSMPEIQQNRPKRNSRTAFNQKLKNSRSIQSSETDVGTSPSVLLRDRREHENRPVELSIGNVNSVEITSTVSSSSTLSTTLSCSTATLRVPSTEIEPIPSCENGSMKLSVCSDSVHVTKPTVAPLAVGSSAGITLQSVHKTSAPVSSSPSIVQNASVPIISVSSTSCSSTTTKCAITSSPVPQLLNSEKHVVPTSSAISFPLDISSTLLVSSSNSVPTSQKGTSQNLQSADNTKNYSDSGFSNVDADTVPSPKVNLGEDSQKVSNLVSTLSRAAKQLHSVDNSTSHVTSPASTAEVKMTASRITNKILVAEMKNTPGLVINQHCSTEAVITPVSRASTQIKINDTKPVTCQTVTRIRAVETLKFASPCALKIAKPVLDVNITQSITSVSPTIPGVALASFMPGLARVLNPSVSQRASELHTLALPKLGVSSTSSISSALSSSSIPKTTVAMATATSLSCASISGNVPSTVTAASTGVSATTSVLDTCPAEDPPKKSSGTEIETENSKALAPEKSKPVESASIAIQCDMDEPVATLFRPETLAFNNESGTQTEGPSKLPLPPSASPFYYLPLAMAALGEKLPAQLVQQMLAKTQGLVGAAEAGMILQQAAQLAQQHQQKVLQQVSTSDASLLTHPVAKAVTSTVIPSGTPQQPSKVALEQSILVQSAANDPSSSGKAVAVARSSVNVPGPVNKGQQLTNITMQHKKTAFQPQESQMVPQPLASQLQNQLVQNLQLSQTQKQSQQPRQQLPSVHEQSPLQQLPQQLQLLQQPQLTQQTPLLQVQLPEHSNLPLQPSHPLNEPQASLSEQQLQQSAVAQQLQLSLSQQQPQSAADQQQPPQAIVAPLSIVVQQQLKSTILQQLPSISAVVHQQSQSTVQQQQPQSAVVQQQHPRPAVTLQPLPQQIQPLEQQSQLSPLQSQVLFPQQKPQVALQSSQQEHHMDERQQVETNDQSAHNLQLGSSGTQQISPVIQHSSPSKELTKPVLEQQSLRSLRFHQHQSHSKLQPQGLQMQQAVSKPSSLSMQQSKSVQPKQSHIPLFASPTHHNFKSSAQALSKVQPIRNVPAKVVTANSKISLVASTTRATSVSRISSHFAETPIIKSSPPVYITPPARITPEAFNPTPAYMAASLSSYVKSSSSTSTTSANHLSSSNNAASSCGVPPSKSPSTTVTSTNRSPRSPAVSKSHTGISSSCFSTSTSCTSSTVTCNKRLLSQPCTTNTCTSATVFIPNSSARNDAARSNRQPNSTTVKSVQPVLHPGPKSSLNPDNIVLAGSQFPNGPVENSEPNLKNVGATDLDLEDEEACKSRVKQSRSRSADEMYVNKKLRLDSLSDLDNEPPLVLTSIKPVPDEELIAAGRNREGILGDECFSEVSKMAAFNVSKKFAELNNKHSPRKSSLESKTASSCINLNTCKSPKKANELPANDHAHGNNDIGSSSAAFAKCVTTLKRNSLLNNSNLEPQGNGKDELIKKKLAANSLNEKVSCKDFSARNSSVGEQKGVALAITENSAGGSTEAYASTELTVGNICVKSALRNDNQVKMNSHGDDCSKDETQSSNKSKTVPEEHLEIEKLASSSKEPVELDNTDNDVTSTEISTKCNEGQTDASKKSKNCVVVGDVASVTLEANETKDKNLQSGSTSRLKRQCKIACGASFESDEENLVECETNVVQPSGASKLIETARNLKDNDSSYRDDYHMKAQIVENSNISSSQSDAVDEKHETIKRSTKSKKTVKGASISKKSTKDQKCLKNSSVQNDVEIRAQNDLESEEIDAGSDPEESSPAPAIRRSSRSSTSAATRATESDQQGAEQLRRHRRAKRAAAALALGDFTEFHDDTEKNARTNRKRKGSSGDGSGRVSSGGSGWVSPSGGSDAGGLPPTPLSPQMSPDTLRGWPPPRLTSPSPSQSSEGASSTTSQRSSQRASVRHSSAASASAAAQRHQSPQPRRMPRASRGTGCGGSVGETKPPQSSPTGSAAWHPDPLLADRAPRVSENPHLARAPSFFPTAEEFTEPLDYIEKIRPEAERFGICRIVPPSSFRPECRVNDDMRFVVNNQHIHRLLKRWGPNVRTTWAIRKCLAKQNIELSSNPLIGGLEVDLVQLYRAVEQLGGLMTVLEEQLWGRVAQICRVPKTAHDRLAKLDSVYCKYLLPYATLKPEEREALLKEADAAHARLIGSVASENKPSKGTHKKPASESNSRSSCSTASSDAESESDSEDEYETLDCFTTGKSVSLSAFYRLARNTTAQWLPDPNGLEVDERYWSIVTEGTRHVCVHEASLDTSEHGYGFPSPKSNASAKHPWNLKNLCQSSNTLLRSMGNVIGVTAPTLHVGMLFSSVCWYRDPHSLPWIEYLHSGASKIWYGVASSAEQKLREAMSELVPEFVKDSPIWLPSDTTMVDPSSLSECGVPVCRVVQEPGQFVLVFPGAFTASLCTGYLIAESAFFARHHYFDRAEKCFSLLAKCREPAMFSLERLVVCVSADARASLDSLARARPLLANIVARHSKLWNQLLRMGLTRYERMPADDSAPPSGSGRATPTHPRGGGSGWRRSRHHKQPQQQHAARAEDEEKLCATCRQEQYLAYASDDRDGAIYCLEHTLEQLTAAPSALSHFTLLYRHTLEDLNALEKHVDDRLQQQQPRGVRRSPAAAGGGKQTRQQQQQACDAVPDPALTAAVSSPSTSVTAASSTVTAGACKPVGTPVPLAQKVALNQQQPMKPIPTPLSPQQQPLKTTLSPLSPQHDPLKVIPTPLSPQQQQPPPLKAIPTPLSPQQQQPPPMKAIPTPLSSQQQPVKTAPSPLSPRQQSMKAIPTPMSPQQPMKTQSPLSPQHQLAALSPPPAGNRIVQQQQQQQQLRNQQRQHQSLQHVQNHQDMPLRQVRLPSLSPPGAIAPPAALASRQQLQQQKMNVGAPLSSQQQYMQQQITNQPQFSQMQLQQQQLSQHQLSHQQQLLQQQQLSQQQKQQQLSQQRITQQPFSPTEQLTPQQQQQFSQHQQIAQQQVSQRQQYMNQSPMSSPPHYPQQPSQQMHYQQQQRQQMAPVSMPVQQQPSTTTFPPQIQQQ